MSRLFLPATALIILLHGAFLTGCTTDPGPPNSTLAADTTIANVSWESYAVSFRGQNKLRVAYGCPVSGFDGIVWGSGPYTDDSSVCTAAVHAGLITLTDGGRVVIEIRGGEKSYKATTRNGITTLKYGNWRGSYVFP